MYKIKLIIILTYTVHRPLYFKRSFKNNKILFDIDKSYFMFYLFYQYINKFNINLYIIIHSKLIIEILLLK